MFTIDLIWLSASKNNLLFLCWTCRKCCKIPRGQRAVVCVPKDLKKQDLSRVHLSEIVLRFAFSLSRNKVHRKNCQQQRYSVVQTTRNCKALPSSSPPCLCKNQSRCAGDDRERQLYDYFSLFSPLSRRSLFAMNELPCSRTKDEPVWPNGKALGW